MRVIGMVIWDGRPRRWWHRLVFWRRRRAALYEAGSPSAHGSWSIEWDENGHWRPS